MNSREITRQITKQGSSTFYFGSQFFPKDIRFAVWSIYAFCRITDDMVDTVQIPKNLRDQDQFYGEQQLKINSVHNYLQFIFINRNSVKDWKYFLKENPKWDLPKEYELIYESLAITVNKYQQLHIEPFIALLSGMEMDLKVQNYKNYDDLAQYSYKVAGSVGEMICNICGISDSETICYAYILGEAMQLTNILRDVGEDYRRGRIYLAQEDLKTYGVKIETLYELAQKGEWSLSNPEIENFVKLVKLYIKENLKLYQKSVNKINALPFRVRKPIMVAANIYKHILIEIEKNDYNVMTKRAFVNNKAKIVYLIKNALYFD